jgi:hypothetical protein
MTHDNCATAATLANRHETGLACFGMILRDWFASGLRSAVISFASADRDWRNCSKLIMWAVLTPWVEKDAAEQIAQGCHGHSIAVPHR